MAPSIAVRRHISFGIAPWDTDGVKRELETRGLKATITPNGYNLQISHVTRLRRLGG